MKEYLIVEIDAIPFTLGHWQIIDYNGALIADLLYGRLYHSSDKGPRPFLARYASSNKKTEWRVTVDTSHQWDDMKKLSAADVVAGYQYCFERRAHTPLVSIFELIDCAKGVNGIELLDDKEFRIFFKADMPCIEEILSSLVFVPVQFYNDTITPFPGRYNLSEISSDVVVLTRNGGNTSGELFNHIIFLKTQNSRQGIKLFNKGMIDLTGNTSFPFRELPNYAHTGNLVSCPLKLTSQLEFNHSRIPALSSPALRNRLYAAIDKTAIATALNDAIVPFESYTTLWDQEEENSGDLVPGTEDCCMQDLQNRTICFANYPPNFNVVSMMVRQVRKETGVTLHPEPVDLETYVKRYVAGDFDLIYTLTSSLFDDPLCFLSHLCQNPLLVQDHPGLHAWANETLAAANALQSRTNRFVTYREIERRLFAQKIFFPLFAVKSFYLKSPALEKSMRYSTMGKLVLNEQ